MSRLLFDTFDDTDAAPIPQITAGASVSPSRAHLFGAATINRARGPESSGASPLRPPPVRKR